MARVVIFIDGMNARCRLEENRWCEYYDVSYFGNAIAGPRELVMIRFYIATPNRQQLGEQEYAKQRSYLQQVASQKDAQLITGYMRQRIRWIEKRVDSAIAADMVYLACKDYFDQAIVVSADADLVPPIERTVELGKRVELVVFKGTQPKIYDLERVASWTRRARPSYFKPYASS